MLPNARPTTPKTSAQTETRSTAPDSEPRSVRRLVGALGGALTVGLLGFLLVTARVAHEESTAFETAPAAAAGIAGQRSSSAEPGASAAEPVRQTAPEPAREVGAGEASFYHSSLEGRPTASGEPYRSTRLTAAHRTLPLGSKVRVTDLASGKAVTVRINDRGPFHGRRVIDLSHAAARQLGMVSRGTARVSLELLTS